MSVDYQRKTIMSKPSVEKACSLLAAEARKTERMMAFDPLVWFPFIMQLLDKLIGCRSEPEDAYDLLTHRVPRQPLRDWWYGTSREERQADYRRNLEVVMKREWVGHPAAVVQLTTTIWDAIDAGKLTRELMRGMYQDVKAGNG